MLHPEATPLIETAEDALAVTLRETGVVDLDRIAELLGRSRETAIAELGECIFRSGSWRSPTTGHLGDGRRRNVAALEKPCPRKPSDITARLGAPWIPPTSSPPSLRTCSASRRPSIRRSRSRAGRSMSIACAGRDLSTDWGTVLAGTPANS